MNNYQRIALIMGIVFALVIWNSFVLAQDLEQEKRAVLRGLQACRVAVEYLRPEIERDGLTREQLQTDTELKLRLVGIRLLSLTELAKTAGAPFFCLNVNALKLSSSRGYIYNISVSLRETVRLMRNGAVIGGFTWKKGYLGITSNLSDIRQKVKDMVDRFINDYLAANPK